MNVEEVTPGKRTRVQTAPEPQPNQVLIHYRRRGGEYSNWGMHIWGETSIQTTWSAPLEPHGQDEFGIYWLIDMMPGGSRLHFIIHLGDIKDPGPDQTLDLRQDAPEIWLVEGDNRLYENAEDAVEALFISEVGDITHKAQVHWVTKEIIAHPFNYGHEARYFLHFDPDGELRLTSQGVVGGKEWELEYLGRTLDPNLATRYPHLQNAYMLRLPTTALASVPEILRGQSAVSVKSADGLILHATALQIPGVLDDLYTYAGPLGVTFEDDRPHLKVWAPTAISVHLQLYPDSDPETKPSRHPMEYDRDTGVWNIMGEPSWQGHYYLYEVEVFVRQEGAVCSNQVTDPYSISLSLNSLRSQIVDLSDPTLKPEGWGENEKPILEHFTDAVLYELHIRDFSAADMSVQAGRRGGYLAFAEEQSAGVRHLARLAEAGVTHVHLLPAADIATINENKLEWKTPDFGQLSNLPGHSPEQQAALAAIRGQDGYNWGYDPFHFMVPEGSYATDPDGPARIIEFRQMVMALNQRGLRVVMDMVFNHTFSARQDSKSVLDKIVPGYYYRLDADGNIFSTTCCMNTASEHAMMEKLMIDTLKIWAEAYKIDGFRFDLMGHHMLENMLNVRKSLDELNEDQHGVDGKAIILYGEGWNFGELAHNARGVNAQQFNVAGTGIGVFNDRIRDAVRGGGPFGNIRQQGFINGLFTEPNETETRPLNAQRAALGQASDLIRLSLAGNLAAFTLMAAHGRNVTGAEIYYNGQPASYTQNPSENVPYISAHDNETLFDAIQYKAAGRASVVQRARMHHLGISIVALCQGLPFFHAGVELLRSKSFDRDSYDSGDWFNRLDFTYQSNNWAVGLPPEEKNGANWPLMTLLLADPALKPGPELIQRTLAHFEEMLRIRRSSPLFRLRSAEQVLRSVRFLNTGPNQVPGLIVMRIEDTDPEPLDPKYDAIIVLINANPGTVLFPVTPENRPFELHPIQQESADMVVRSAVLDLSTSLFGIPGRTTAVFVRRRA